MTPCTPVIVGKRPLRITTSATTQLVGESCSLGQVVIGVEDAGTAWTLKLQDAATPPNVLMPAFTMALPTDGKPIVLNFDQPIPMIGGIKAVTAGTAGAVNIWLTVNLGGS